MKQNFFVMTDNIYTGFVNTLKYQPTCQTCNKVIYPDMQAVWARHKLYCLACRPKEGVVNG